MSLRERWRAGWNQGQKTAETIYGASSQFESARDPELRRELARQGITQEDINNLTIRPSLRPEDIGSIVAGIIFYVKHGGMIWNSADMQSFRK